MIKPYRAAMAGIGVQIRAGHRGGGGAAIANDDGAVVQKSTAPIVIAPAGSATMVP